MTRKKAARDLDQEAAAWALRIDGLEADELDDRDFKAWLAADRRHPGALLRAQAALDLVDRAHALYGPGHVANRRPPPPSRRGLIVGLFGVAAAAGVAVVLVRQAPRRFESEKGEVRRIPLPDGSVMVLNTATIVETRLGRSERRIVVRQGEAWFEVDGEARPFVVEAGPARIRARAGAFAVRRFGEATQVMATSGEIETGAVGSARPPAALKAGYKIVLDPRVARPAIAATDEIGRRLAWLDGNVDLAGESLAEAAAEFNRYNARQVFITDPTIARTPVYGVFETTDLEGFLRMVLATRASIRRDGARIEIARAP